MYLPLSSAARAPDSDFLQQPHGGNSFKHTLRLRCRWRLRRCSPRYSRRYWRRPPEVDVIKLDYPLEVIYGLIYLKNRKLTDEKRMFIKKVQEIISLD